MAASRPRSRVAGMPLPRRASRGVPQAPWRRSERDAYARPAELLIASGAPVLRVGCYAGPPAARAVALGLATESAKLVHLHLCCCLGKAGAKVRRRAETAARVEGRPKELATPQVLGKSLETAPATLTKVNLSCNYVKNAGAKVCWRRGTF